MKHAHLQLIAFFFGVLVSVTAWSNETSERPNILIIMADDLGFSDLGCYGGEIETPHLDRLAANGLRFTQFYNTGRCWPTRASLLTGYYAHQVRRDTVPGLPSGGRGVRPDWAPLLAERLKAAGYGTNHIGKWHIDGMPLENGFDRSYYLKDQGRFFSPQVHFLDDVKQPAVSRDEDFYGTEALGNHAVEFLRQHAARSDETPFFCYLAFTAPHFPLHARQRDIDLYRDRYHVGWDEIRRQRWQRIQDEGLIRGMLSPAELQVGPPYDFPDAIDQLGPGEVNRPLPWDQLTGVQQQFQATKMAIHAAMIDSLDRQVGRVFDQLETMDAAENTLVMFLSDNGASAEIMVRSDGHDPAAPPGSADSYLCLGPGWSTSSNTPFRMHKTWVHEGGICTPFIVHWPRSITTGGQLRHSPGHVVDIVPTVCAVAGLEARGVEATAPAESSETLRAPPLPGRNLAPVFAEDRPVDRPFLWWEHEGNRAIRVGDWKLVAAGRDGEWELFDLRHDRTETKDLSAEHPDRVAQMARAWQQAFDRFVDDAVGTSEE